mgnify:CR=1 FL=1
MESHPPRAKKSANFHIVNTVKAPGLRCLIIVCQMQEDEYKNDYEMVEMGKAINNWDRYKNTSKMITLIGAKENFFESVLLELKSNPYQEVIICGHSIYYKLNPGNGPKIDSFPERHVGDLKIDDMVHLLEILIRADVQSIMFVACEVAMNQNFKEGNIQLPGDSDLTFEKSKTICNNVDAGDLNVSTLEVICGKFFLHSMNDIELREKLSDESHPIHISGLIGVGFIVAEIEEFNTFDQSVLNLVKKSRKSNQLIVNDICSNKIYPDVMRFTLCPSKLDPGAESKILDSLFNAGENIGNVWCNLVLEYGISEEDTERVEGIIQLMGKKATTSQCKGLIKCALKKNFSALKKIFSAIFTDSV